VDRHAHAVRGFVRGGTFVFLTDSAVGEREEHNLRHLVINLGTDVPRSHVVPFLTSKHSLAFCLGYAERAWQEGFTSLVVLGGDRNVGPPRCVEHAWELRDAIRRHVPELTLGGWANPHADASRQLDYLGDANFSAEFFLTQVISHHDSARLNAFAEALGRRRPDLPGIFGVFYYRSANPRTIAALKNFLPVPAAGLTAEFGAGVSAEEICARTIRALRAAGARHFYVSNLPIGRARQTMSRIMELVEERPNDRRGMLDRPTPFPIFPRRQTPRSVDASSAGAPSTMAFDGERFRIARIAPPPSRRRARTIPARREPLGPALVTESLPSAEWPRQSRWLAASGTHRLPVSAQALRFAPPVREWSRLTATRISTGAALAHARFEASSEPCNAASTRTAVTSATTNRHGCSLLDDEGAQRAPRTIDADRPEGQVARHRTHAGSSARE
jgi:hypothetical protein